MINCVNCGSLTGYGNCDQCGAPNPAPQTEGEDMDLRGRLIEVPADDEAEEDQEPGQAHRAPARPAQEGVGCGIVLMLWLVLAIISFVIIGAVTYPTQLTEAATQQFRIMHGWMIVLQDEVVLEDARSLAPFKIVHGEEMVEGETVFEGPFTMSPGRWYVQEGVVDITLSAEEPFPVTLMKAPGELSLIWGVWAVVALFLGFLFLAAA